MHCFEAMQMYLSFHYSKFMHATGHACKWPRMQWVIYSTMTCCISQRVDKTARRYIMSDIYLTFRASEEGQRAKIAISH